MIPKAPAHTLSLKDALVHAGLLDKARAGRGRPSREMKANAEMLVRDHNYLISGFAATKSSDSTKPVEVRHTPKTSTPTAVVDVPDIMRGEDLIPIMPNGKVWPMGMKGVCNTCKSSLTYCPCVSPVVNLDYNHTGVVTFRTKVPNKEVRK